MMAASIYGHSSDGDESHGGTVARLVCGDHASFRVQQQDAESN